MWQGPAMLTSDKYLHGLMAEISLGHLVLPPRTPPHPLLSFELVLRVKTTSFFTLRIHNLDSVSLVETE
jgi:hypothetical protein